MKPVAADGVSAKEEARDPSPGQVTMLAGLSIRDQFAMAALPCFHQLGSGVRDEMLVAVSKAAYRMADTMLAERDSQATQRQ